jgi:diguanylate cyclase (GGDEF)-like protein
MKRDPDQKTPVAVPDDVYVQFVRSLFNSARTVLIGAFIHALAAFLVYWNNARPIYAVIGILLLAIGVWRYAGMVRFRKSPEITTRAEAWQWEREYLVKGSIQALILGFFCFASLYISQDSFAQLAGFGVTLGSLVTVAGRNYGSPRMVTIFAACFVGPIGLGLMLRGDLPHVVLGLIIIPFYFIITETANQVRQVLFSAVIGHRRANQIAHRFNRALNTMTSGLVMLDPEGKVVVANAEAATLMRVDDPQKLLGRTLRGLLLRGVAGGLLSRKDFQYAESQLSRARREGEDRKVLLKLRNGSYYEFSAREGQDELGVVTFEEVTQRVNSEERIRYMARYDSLTALPNRAYFNEYLGELVAGGDPERLCGIAIFDLDDFKSINDTLGHPVGDGLIVAVAEKLAAHAGPNVVVGRFGGDEFMIFLNQVTDEAELTDLLDQIFSGLQGTVDVAGHALRVQMSAGAVLSRAGKSDVDGMIVKADLALYKAKEDGKNRWRLFESIMDEEFRNRQLLKADLRSAVEAKALRVVYQPIVSMNTMRIASCEALCRWDHPELGPISPAIFIPLAEEMGIVSEISTFILEAACTECVKWPERIGVSINLSARDFRTSEVVTKIEAALLQFPGMRDVTVKVEAKDGQVTLSGLIPVSVSAEQITRRIEMMPEVKIVNSDLVNVPSRALGYS